MKAYMVKDEEGGLTQQVLLTTEQAAKAFAEKFYKDTMLEDALLTEWCGPDCEDHLGESHLVDADGDTGLIIVEMPIFETAEEVTRFLHESA